MTGRWEALTPDEQTTVLLNLRSWLDLGDDPLIRSALDKLCGHPCPTCGPTATEPHPRRDGVVRCGNCKTHLDDDRPVVAPYRPTGALTADDVHLPAEVA